MSVVCVRMRRLTDDSVLVIRQRANINLGRYKELPSSILRDDLLCCGGVVWSTPWLCHLHLPPAATCTCTCVCCRHCNCCTLWLSTLRFVSVDICEQRQAAPRPAPSLVASRSAFRGKWRRYSCCSAAADA